MQQPSLSIDIGRARTAPERELERVAAALFFLYAAAQVTQSWILARLPAGEDPATRYAVALSGPDRFRAVFLYACFLGLPLAYVAVYRRLRSGWALAGLVWTALFLALELVNRAAELVPMAAWQRAWLAAGAQDPIRQVLSSRLELMEALQYGSYLPLLLAHALGSLAFAIALRDRDPWSRLARVGFALNFVRAAVRVGAMHLGMAALAPIADAIYLPLTLAQVVSVALWLAIPRRAEGG